MPPFPFNERQICVLNGLRTFFSELTAGLFGKKLPQRQIHVRLRLVHADAGLQPANDHEPVGLLIVEETIRAIRFAVGKRVVTRNLVDVARARRKIPSA